jgi:hypothetical protein
MFPKSLTDASVHPTPLSFFNLLTLDFLPVSLQRAIDQNTLVHGTAQECLSKSSLVRSAITVVIDESLNIFSSTICKILSFLFQMQSLIQLMLN